MKRSVMALALALAACGGSDNKETPDASPGTDSGSGADAPAGLDVEQLDEAYGESFCERLFSCCNPDEEELWGGRLGFTDLASCKTSQAADYEQNVLAALKARVAAGELTYDSGAAAECTTQIANVTCSLFFTDYAAPACSFIFRGMVAAGDSCAEDVDCASGYCSTRGQSGTCETRAALNASCDTAECEIGLGCSAAKICIMPKADGEACEASSECQSQDCSTTCVAETVCDGNDAN